ncbi:MAG: type II toxin-antitoxin system VapB family antitoxin [Actinomycetota bacterium]|nr:type II toxin-antitoxin system VapB family antitoxin [Actinomycetota bacterium]
MALNIKDSQTDQLARELAEATGETITGAVSTAVRERLERVRGRASKRSIADEVNEIVERFAALPVIDDRSPDEIIGYDEHGLPT